MLEKAPPVIKLMMGVRPQGGTLRLEAVGYTWEPSWGLSGMRGSMSGGMLEPRL
jgi:hypothetical protein